MKHTDLKHFIISIACIFVSSIIFIGLFFHDNKYTHAGCNLPMAFSICRKVNCPAIPFVFLSVAGVSILTAC